MNDETDPVPAYREAIKRVAAVLEDAVHLSRLQNDPLAHLVRGLRDTLIVLGDGVAVNQSVIASHRLHIDRDFDAIRQARDTLTITTNQTVIAAKAEVDAAYATMSQKFVATAARSVEQKITSMSRWIMLRTLALGSALAIVILALGFGLGYWRGNTTGYDQAASSIQASGPIEKAVLADQGPAGLHQWHQFMQDNGILATMKDDCKGKSIAHQDGRTACHLWLWTTPFVQPPAHG